MKGFLTRRLFSFVLTLVIILQAVIILFDIYSYGVLEEKPWFRRWPFYAGNSGLMASTYDFAYNGNYVEVVVGLREGYQENVLRLFSLVNQKKTGM